MHEYEIPDAYLFLRHYDRLLYYKNPEETEMNQHNENRRVLQEYRHNNHNHNHNHNNLGLENIPITTYDENADKPRLGIYGVLDLLNGVNIELKQHVNNANHRESVMSVTLNQSKIIYYAKFKNKERNNKREGIIQINNLENGELLGSITLNTKMSKKIPIPLKPRWCLSSEQNKKRRNIFVTRNPLKSVRAINYNEIQNEIYTGYSNGDIIVWA